jgi:hypothetical protein
LVLVIEVYTDADPWLNACLIADAVDGAGDKDVRLNPEETGLSFPVLVQADVVGPLFPAQLGPPLGVIDASLLRDLRSAVYGEWTATLGARRGLAIMRREDARWHLKEEEVATMHALAHACMDHLLRTDVTEAANEAVLDPAFFDDDSPLWVVPALLKAMSVVEANALRLDVPTERLAQTGQLAGLAEALNPDEVRALEAVWQGCLRADVPEIAGGHDAQWRPDWAGPSADLLARHLARRAAMGKRAFRVLTSRRHWRRTTWPGVLALDVEGVGRVQVKPELVEEAA